MLHGWKKTKFAAAAGIFAYFSACAPVNFGRQESPACGQNGVVCQQSCVGNDCRREFTIERRVGDALVDILFVNDNSGSMSTEQAKMADKFPGFISSLDAKKLNYRIAMITTDISNTYSTTPVGVVNGPKAANGNGAFQDGRLIEFSSGVKFLTPQVANRASSFAVAVKRNETGKCETSGFQPQSCPSNDERGIFAANLVLEQTGAEFLRPTAHLAVVILSDEDERGISDSRAALNANDQALINLYPLEGRDRVDTFIGNMRNLYPDKTYSVHSVIIRPKEYATNSDELNKAKECLDEQNGQGTWTRGYPAYSYAELSKRSGGTIGSICENDYSVVLNNIGFNIQDQVTSLPFNCSPLARADGSRFAFYLNDVLRNDLVTPLYDQNKLEINIALAPMTKVKLVYDCPVD